MELLLCSLMIKNCVRTRSLFAVLSKTEVGATGAAAHRVRGLKKQKQKTLWSTAFHSQSSIEMLFRSLLCDQR